VHPRQQTKGTNGQDTSLQPHTISRHLSGMGFSRTQAVTALDNPSFDNAFEDPFDFTKAELSTSFPGINLSSSGPSASPPAPTSSMIVKPAITPVRDSGFENAFRPQQNTASSARPAVSAINSLPVLPPVPESLPFSFVQSFSSDLLTAPAPTTTIAPNVTTPGQPPSAPGAPKLTFKEIGNDHYTRTSKFSVSGRSPSPGIEKMTFLPIIDPSALWEEEDTGLTGIASFRFPTFESDSR